jgi:hypothetical protein
LPYRPTRRSIMQKVRRHPLPSRRGAIGLRPLVGTRFQVLFTPLDGVLFTFQSPYWYTIGRWRVLSLGRWTSLLHTEFHEHRATLGHRTEGPSPFAYGSITLCGGPFQILRLGRPFSSPNVRAHNPHPKVGLGWSPFARRYLGSRNCFLLLRVLRCFSSPGSPRRPMHSAAGEPGRLPARHGLPHSGIQGSTLGWQLPLAYRSLLRPSSPSSA